MDLKERREYSKNGLKKLRVLENVTSARLKIAFMLGEPHTSIQASETKIFSEPDGNGSSDETSLFLKIYKNADPSDFILPNIFWHLLNKIKSDAPCQTHPCLLYTSPSPRD